MTRRRRLRTAVLMSWLAAVTVATTLAPAAAQTTTGTVTLAAQTAFHAPDQPFSLSLRVRSAASPSAVEVAVSTYRRLTTRTQFAQSVEGRFATRSPIDVSPIERVDALPVDADGVVTLSFTPVVARDGVYPMRVDLRDSETHEVIDSFTTHLINLPAVMEADPLDVALVLPVHTGPSIRPDGKTALDERAAASFGELAASLDRHSSVPVTIAPTAETLEALATGQRAADRDTTAALARMTRAGDHQVVTGTYVPTDLRALLDAGLGGELAAQLERAQDTVRRHLGASVAPDLRPLDERLDAGALGQLAAQGVTRLVVPEATLEPVSLRLTLTQTVAVRAASGPLTAAVADTALAAHATRNVPPVLAAHHLLADLAVLWGDEPSRAEKRRGVVVEPARGWAPTSEFLDVLLQAVSTSPLLQPVTLDTFFAEVAPAVSSRGQPVVRAFRSPESSTGLGAGSIRAARRRLEAFASIVQPENPIVGQLDRTLLTSQSADLRARDRGDYVTGVSRQIDAQLAAIEMPQRRSITLTAREGQLPVTITSRLGYPVRVVLTLDGEALDFPRGSTREIELTRENTTEQFEVHARGSGSFPAQVRVSSPVGELLLAESRFTVRSTAVSGMGIGLSVGAALFLLVWWASHLRTRRKQRRAGSPLPPTPELA